MSISMSFTLDTSGYVSRLAAEPLGTLVGWADVYAYKAPLLICPIAIYVIVNLLSKN